MVLNGELGLYEFFVFLFFYILVRNLFEICIDFFIFLCRYKDKKEYIWKIINKKV